MSLADTMFHTIYVPMAKRDGPWQEDGVGGGADNNPYLESRKQGMLLRSSNLAVAGFPSSLQPFDFACFPAADFDAKRGIINTSRHGDDLKSQITVVMQGRCEPNNISSSSPRNNSDGRFKELDRCVVDLCHGKETLTARAPKDSVRGDGSVPLELRQEKRDCTNETRASPPSTKPLKFGIEAILAIGNKEPEKKIVNLSDYKHRILGRWNGELTVPPEASSELYGHATGRSGGSKHAAAAYPSPRSSWGNTSPRPPGHPGSRWECLPGFAEAGRVGWVARDHCPEYHDNFPSRHSPYPWTRTSDPTIQHCFQLQPTLPPSHPTLPRSFHQAASASSMRSTLVQQDNGQDVKSNIGGSGGIVGSIAGNHKRKRSWSRAVFTSLQRKGLEKRFEIQKYVNKPERRQLASALGLSDAQVKVWFQNRRMKWRHTQQFNRPHDIPEGHTEDIQTQPLDMVHHINPESDDSNNNDIETEDQMRSRKVEFGDSSFADCNSSDEDIQQ